MRRLLLTLVSGAAVIGWVLLLRPTALGGDVSYVVVDGRSMEPTYEDGDLVLVREESFYEDGDVIAFRAGGRFDDPTRIIHRVVGTNEDGSFRTQGDNRDVLDPWQPTDEDIIGRATLHIPMAGDVASFFARPQTMAALGGAAVVVGGQRRRRRRRDLRPRDTQDEPVNDALEPTPPREPAQAPRGSASGFLAQAQPRWAAIGLACSVVLAIPTLALAWSALRAPDSTQRVEQFGAVEYGIDLGYTFTGVPSAVYPDGEINATTTPAGALEAPMPLYTRLLDRVEVVLDFRTEVLNADRVESSYAVGVTLETPDGWSTALDGSAIERTSFRSSTTDTVRIDLDRAAERVAAIAALTGVGGSDFTITVVPRLDVAASADDAAITNELTSPLTFAVEGDVITASGAEIAQTDPLSRTIDEHASYAIGPYEMTTQTARAVLSGFSLVVVAGIVWFASVLFGGFGLGEPARIAARYRSQIVDVSSASAPPGAVIMVDGIEELARIAKVDQNVILHEDLGDGAHRYRVFLGTVTYEYETAPEHAGAATTDVEATEPGPD